jgi:hypothetical protein
MQLSKNKTAAITIALFLIISMSASMLLIPVATAHTPAWPLATNAYVVAAPDNLGVGQSTLIYMWLNKVFDGATMQNNYRFHNFQLTITDPDGVITEKTFDYISDTTSNQGYSYTPTKVGTYTVLFNFPGQDINTYAHNPTSAYVNDTYLSSNMTTTFTVQQDPIGYLPFGPLPTEYWARPIYGQNPNWWIISSNWLGTGAVGYGGYATGGNYNTGGNGMLLNPSDNVGSQTSHIMWTKPLQMGGVVGGDLFDIAGDTYFEGSAYQQRYTNPIIVNGKLYFTEPIQFHSPNGGETKCVDLRTGNLVWSRQDVPALSFAYIYDVQTPNQHGVWPAILCTTNFARCFDAETGAPIFNVTGVPSVSYQALKASGPGGEQLRYYFGNIGNSSAPNWTLAEWNSTKLIDWSGNSPVIRNITGSATWSMTGGVNNPTGSPGDYTNQAFTIDASISNPALSTCRNDWNVSVPWRNTMTGSITYVYSIYNDILLGYNGTLPSQGATFMGTLGFNTYTYFAISLKPESRGQLLWMKNYDPPANNVTVLFGGVDPINRVFVENLRETNNFVGYNLDTGAKLWGPTPSQPALDYYGSPASGSITSCFAYGQMYSVGMAGVVYCYDTKTGNTLWTFGNGAGLNNTDSGFEAPGHYPMSINAIGNGVVYAVTTEHTIETPIYKGAMVRGLNATTGEQIWSLNTYIAEFSAMSFCIADGYTNFYNGYDQQLYTLGKGPTQLTVSAPASGVTLCNSMVISGRVSDISSGTNQDATAMRFPNGLPCADDSVMGEYMSYVYQQQAFPTNFKGVTVDLTVVDANGNYRSIGTTTTDSSGVFTYTWTPDIDGKYSLYASFAGTNGYWPSSDSTAFVVDPAPATATPQPTQTPSIADQYFIPATAGLFVALIVVIVLVLLVLMKKRQ